MKIEIKYGSMIHTNDTIAKYEIIKFDNLEELKKFWQNERSIAGDWEAHLDSLVIKHTSWVKSSEYFETLEDGFTLEADF